MTAPSLLETHPHEFGAHLLFTEYDLKPYFAARNSIQEHDGGGSDLATFEHNERTYTITFSYQSSGIAPREDDEINEVHEYRIRVHEVDAPERKASFLIQPRWASMETKEGKPIPTPDVLAVNVKTQGANIEPDAYPTLLRKAARRLDINAQYFEEVHDYSTIYDAARYVRIREQKSRKIHSRNGVLKRTGELVAETDYRKLVQDDRKKSGYYHTVTFSSDGAQRLLRHRYAKEIKHYHTKHPDSFDEDSPLRHPKLETSFQKSKNKSGAVPWHERDRLKRELEEQILNLLGWTGLPLRDDGYTYISDGYHDVDESERDLQLIDDPTPEIRDEQDALVVQKLRDMNESDVEVIDEIVTDGGAKPAEIADETEYHISTIYRALKRLEELVERGEDGVRVASRHLAQRLHDAVQDAEEVLKQTVDKAARALDMSEKELDRRGSALVRWMQEYGGEIEDPENEVPMVEIRNLTGTDIKEAVRELLRAWEKVGKSKRRLKLGTVAYDHPRLDRKAVSDIGGVANRRGTIPAKSRRR